jgi:hypothetical protein
VSGGSGPDQQTDLGQLGEARHAAPVRNPGGLLTKIMKDIATEAGILLLDARPI